MVITKSEIPCILDAIYSVSPFKEHFLPILEKEKPKIVERMWDAIKERKERVYFAITDKIVGTYPYTPETEVIIENDVKSVLIRTAGQPWEMESVDGLGKRDFYSVFDDIENGSAVAYLIGKERGNIYCRLMLRVCKHGKKYKIGLDNMFAVNASRKQIPANSTDLVGPYVDAVSLTKFIEGIISSAGMLDYDRCTTPKPYSGYSAVSRDRGEKITYKRKKK